MRVAVRFLVSKGSIEGFRVALDLGCPALGLVVPLFSGCRSGGVVLRV